MLHDRCSVDENGKAIKGKLWQSKAYHRLCSCHFTTPPNPKRRLLGWNFVKPDKLQRRPPRPRPTSKSRMRVQASSVMV